MSKVRVTLDVETIYPYQGVVEVARIIGDTAELLFDGAVSWAELISVTKKEEPDDE